MLKKAPAGGSVFQSPAHPGEQPLVIGKCRADPCGRGLIEMGPRRSEEAFGEARGEGNGMGRERSRYEKFRRFFTHQVNRHCAETRLFPEFADIEWSRDPRRDEPHRSTSAPAPTRPSLRFFTEFWTPLPAADERSARAPLVHITRERDRDFEIADTISPSLRCAASPSPCRMRKRARGRDTGASARNRRAASDSRATPGRRCGNK